MTHHSAAPPAGGPHHQHGSRAYLPGTPTHLGDHRRRGGPLKLGFLGNSRFIGHSAATTAVADGHDVVIVHTGKYDVHLPGGRCTVGSREQLPDLRRTLDELRPDAVVVTNAMTEAHAQADVEALRDLVPRVVVLSSVDVYAQLGNLIGHPARRLEDRVREDSDLNVPFPYRGIADHRAGPDYDKKLVERTFRTSGAFDAVTLLRLPPTYGSGDYKRRFGAFVDAFDRGLRRIPRKGGRWRWTHGHVRDVAAVIVAAATRCQEPVTVLNVGESTTPTMSEWVEHIAAGMGVDFDWEEVEDLPMEFHELGTKPNDFVLDVGRCQQTLGIDDSDLSWRVDDLIRWIRESRT